MASVTVESGPQAGKTIALDKDKVTFGRHYDCDCVLKHPTVSREHFYIERNAGKYFIVDQNSNNGTFANGERVSWLELKDGDRIRAGPFTLTVALKRVTSNIEPNTLAMAARPTTASLDDARHLLEMANSQLYPREYLMGIDHFNARRYFEAHEAWEEIWLRSDGDAKLFYQMLIQAAVGLHHYERGNARGAKGMYENVCEKLSRLPQLYMSLDLIDFSRQYKSFFDDLIAGGAETPPPAERTRPRINLLGDKMND
ncbi:MAG TPA: DUF309 domain-containing protein [Blastocatellia bacterium]|nr:DUF309 domain-containing protein [Blastocatellia bacterium]